MGCFHYTGHYKYTHEESLCFVNNINQVFRKMEKAGRYLEWNDHCYPFTTLRGLKLKCLFDDTSRTSRVLVYSVIQTSSLLSQLVSLSSLSLPFIFRILWFFMSPTKLSPYAYNLKAAVSGCLERQI